MCLRQWHTRLFMAAFSVMREDAPDRLMIRSAGKIVLFNPEEIDWIEASANYVRIHAGAREYIARETMAGIEKRLAGRPFVRIHRSIIVNVRRVRRVEACSASECALVLADGKELPIGRSRRAQVDALLRGLGEAAGTATWASPTQS